jgi:hypothetical protein
MHFYGTWSHFGAFRGGKNNKKKNFFLKEGRRQPFRQERGAGHPFLTGLENTERVNREVSAKRGF